MSSRLLNGQVQTTGVPRIDTSVENEAVLWRYMDTAKFLDFVLGSKLYFSRGDQFEDKFEGTFTKAIKQAILQSYKDQNIDPSYNYNRFKKKLREKVFLNCWHLSVDDSMAMWNMYGQSETAVAITTTVDQLAKAVHAENLPYYIDIKKVEYIKHWRNPPLIVNPYSNVFAYKVQAYEFEKEVRVIVDRFENGTSNEKIKEKGMSVSVNQNAFLKSIVLSPTAPKWFVLLVSKIAAERGISVDVHRSKLWFKPV